MDDPNLDNLFEEAATNEIITHNKILQDERKEVGLPETKESYADKVIRDIENEYKGIGTARMERQKEKKELQDRLKETTKKLKNVKNVKNHKLVNINAKAAELRKKLREEIKEIKDRLYDIDIEEKGSEVSSSKMVDTTIQENLKI